MRIKLLIASISNENQPGQLKEGEHHVPWYSAEKKVQILITMYTLVSVSPDVRLIPCGKLTVKGLRRLKLIPTGGWVWYNYI